MSGEGVEFPRKQLLLVGDRVLITPEEGDDRTRVGLYLPATAVDTQQVQGGLIVAVGPGDAVPDISAFDDEPWKAGRSEKPFVVQTYRRDMGGGQFVLMKDLSSPIVIRGKHWGAFRMGFRQS